MAYPVVAFVEQPAASPVTVLDLNGDGSAHLMHEDFTLGAPEWTAEPDTVAGDDGYRTFGATVCVHRSYTDAAATMQALGRVLQRPTSWLMVQREAGHPPMFLRCYRTPPEAVNWSDAYADTYRLPLSITCDPYLYGEPITLPAATITNNPASGTNRAFIRYPADTFAGDAPAPLKVSVVPSAAWAGYQPLMASAALAPGWDQTAAYWWDLTVAGGWAAVGTNIGGDVAGSGFVGGSYREMTAGGALATRLTGTLTPAPAPGTYKVMLRVALAGDQASYNVRFGQGYDTGQVRYGDTKTITRPDTTIGAYAAWMDLGEFTFPYGAADLDPTDTGTVTAPTVEIQAAQAGAAVALRFDALMLVPVDTAATLDTVIQISRFRTTGLTTTRSGVWDGQRQRFAAYDSGSSLANQRHPEIRGGWLRATPGVVNVLHLLQQTQIDTPTDVTLDDTDKTASTAAVTLSYMPRWLHLRTDP